MLRAMVSRSRLKSVLTGLALYAIAAAMIGYFGVNAYTRSEEHTSELQSLV